MQFLVITTEVINEDIVNSTIWIVTKSNSLINLVNNFGFKFYLGVAQHFFGATANLVIVRSSMSNCIPMYIGSGTL